GKARNAPPNLWPNTLPRMPAATEIAAPRANLIARSRGRTSRILRRLKNGNTAGRWYPWSAPTDEHPPVEREVHGDPAQPGRHRPLESLAAGTGDRREDAAAGHRDAPDHHAGHGLAGGAGAVRGYDHAQARDGDRRCRGEQAGERL